MVTQAKGYDPVKDGISYSNLVKWMECREKSKLHLAGWTPKLKSFPLTFGTVVHEILHLGYEGMRMGKFATTPNPRQVKRMIKKVEKQWLAENTRASSITMEHFELALLFSEAVLPIYFDYWTADRLVEWQEVERFFRVPWKLPDGSKTELIGRKDICFKRLKRRGIWLTETKTSSRIDEEALITLLPIEQQTMLYCVAHLLETKKYPVGVLYNVIRRPGLRRGAKESIKAFAKRCADDVDKRRSHYFLRLEMAVGKAEIDKAKKELGEVIWDFVRWHRGQSPHYKNTSACQNKYGRCEFLRACASRDFRALYMRNKITGGLETK
jgi:hypothetical protein